MNLQHLRTFVSVWRTGSISKACADLGITQPAASGQIRALEAELGHMLFRRHTRGVEPTVVADELARAIGTRLDSSEAAFERLRARSDELEGTIHIAGPSEFMGVRMPPVLTALAAHGIDINVRFGGRDKIYQWFANEEIEVGITASEPADPALGYEPVFEEQLLVVASPRLGLSAPPRADWHWLAYDDTLPLIRTYLAAVHADLPAHPKLVAGSLTFLRDAAIAGAGVGVFPDYLCRDALNDGTLVLVDPAVKLPVNRIFLVWRKAALRHPRVIFARDRCRDELRKAAS